MSAYIYKLVYLSIFLYILAAVFYFLPAKYEFKQRIALGLTIGGLLANSLAIIARTLLVGRLPLANGAEFILWFTWFTIFTYLFYEIKSQNKGAGGPVNLVAALLLASIPLLMSRQLGDVAPLMPALKSPWLTSHVLTAVFAYGSFAVAAGIAAVQLKKNSTSAEAWINRIVAVGFAMMTLTIVLGAIWAEQAWGRYWSWDPKETWALITWIIYAIYFHLYYRRDWKGRRANILLIAGFVLVLFTFFGVSYLLSGLHSYA